MVIKKVVSSGDQYAIFVEVEEEDFHAICSNRKWLPLTPDRAFGMKPGHYVEGLCGYHTHFSQDGILSYLVVLDDNRTIVAIRAGASLCCLSVSISLWRGCEGLCGLPVFYLSW